MRTDGRGLTHATLTELRKRGVAAVQSGESPTQVAATLGVNLRTCFAGSRCTGVADGIGDVPFAVEKGDGALRCCEVKRLRTSGSSTA